MFNLEEKNCPYFQENCLTERCAMWDSKLTNCAIRLNYINAFNLTKALEKATMSDSQEVSKSIPFMTPPLTKKKK